MNGLLYYKVIPVIMSYNGLMYKYTGQLFKEIKVKVEWGKVLTKVLLHNVFLIYRIYAERGKWRKRRREFLINHPKDGRRGTSQHTIED